MALSHQHNIIVSYVSSNLVFIINIVFIVFLVLLFNNDAKKIENIIV